MFLYPCFKMEFKYGPLRSIDQPHLQFREEIKLVAEDVGLYDRDTRLTEYDQGTVALSNFSLYWYTNNLMIGFYCDQISSIEMVPRLLRRHSKIKVYFKESLLQLSFRGDTNVSDFLNVFQSVLDKKEWLNMGGVLHLINKNKQSVADKKELVSNAFSSLDKILLKMNELIELAKSKDYLLPDLQITDNVNETIFNVIQHVLKQNQLVDLLTLYYIVNKSNQYHSVSPKELQIVVNELAITNKIVHRELNGHSFVQSLEFDDNAFIAKVSSLFDHYEAVNVSLVSSELEVPWKTTMFMLEWFCESGTAIVKDDCLNETLYYKNKLFI
eukprot:NODE_40_length_29852_cov_0.370215.p8 type:complete len:327 gc:universal NODE_40_length_29852_cov_0.370215:25124-26104(+)